MSDKYDWLVQIPVNADDVRAWANAREGHVAHLKPYIENGTIVFAGPTLKTHPKGTEDKLEVTSSVMMFRARTEEEVRAIIGKNPFVEVGVWDMDRTVVSPFRCGVRTAL
ncbi:hypothetical protein BDV29DRAFT_198445 [Aspergillus leporis]|jgi:uncharacterized protein YciI|uniref:YCII-related domain-containing protein n=1 Tax=Aspergillus leporis TaxID=41062 RepID=A0A5N5XAA6_9EURO|nr:hypothetical protein BDV29DRAFT_198445 [Aspergillus leporis]